MFQISSFHPTNPLKGRCFHNPWHNLYKHSNKRPYHAGGVQKLLNVIDPSIFTPNTVFFSNHAIATRVSALASDASSPTRRHKTRSRSWFQLLYNDKPNSRAVSDCLKPWRHGRKKQVPTINQVTNKRLLSIVVSIFRMEYCLSMSFLSSQFTKHS